MLGSLIDNNPLLKRPILTALQISENNQNWSRKDLEKAVEVALENVTVKQSPSTIVDILLRNGGLDEQILLNGAPYEGSMEDLQTDEQVDDDAEVERTIYITASGSALLSEYNSGVRLQCLLSQHPEHREIYLKLLRTCMSPEGCSRSSLETLLSTEATLQRDKPSGAMDIYPQYFLDTLEEVDGIYWQSSAWKTTETGRAVVKHYE